MQQRKTQRTSWARTLLKGGVVAGFLGLTGTLGAGCLTRPVSTQPPTTKTNFTAVVRQAAVDKVDLLFMIDNSASMGDKQELLREAVPDLITRLVQPNCIDDTNPNNIVVLGQCTPETNGSGKCDCAMGKLEFPPVHDMHIGIVSSSLGGRGSDACQSPAPNPVNSSVDTHNDDKGELINRGDMNPASGMDQEVAVADANPENFLAWFPSVQANMGKVTPMMGWGGVAITDSNQLISDFQEMVAGVHEYGCGYEAQLESWYRFLVQPDPFDHISRDQGECSAPGAAPNGMQTNFACLVGVDTTILKQRADFLRPDSLLAVIAVTDENEEVVDPLAIGGQGWAFEDSNFPGSPNGQAARGTSQCGGDPTLGPNPGPTDPGCTSCGFGQNASDPNCMNNGGYYTQAEDEPNVRGFHQKQRFGIDPQFPISRYINGLTGYNVPDRVGEHQGSSPYLGMNNCPNPIFAANLPTDPGQPDPKTGEYTKLCQLGRGPRTPDIVFFALIGGVPHELLQAKPGDPDCPSGTAPADCPQKSTLSSNDWLAILGKDPINYDFTGMDPHMFESESPRGPLGPSPLTNAPIPGPAGNTQGTDPIMGRDWNTNASDLQYACTFKLNTPKDCTSPLHINACDCTMGRCDKCTGAGDTTCVCPPLCDPANPTSQIRGKAYPSIRELTVVRSLADQGIASSMCPIHIPPAGGCQTSTDPLCGYRPAVKAIVDRLKNALANQCLPQKLTPSNCGNVACLILETIPTQTGFNPSDPQYINKVQAACAMFPGLTAPDPTVLAKFNQQQDAAWSSNGGADAGLGPQPSTTLTCQVTQLVNSMAGPFDPSCMVMSAEAQGHYQYIGDFAAGSCAAASEAGWCYVQGAAAGTCSQAILFSASGNPQVGAQINLQCIETNTAGDGGGGGGG